MVQVPSQRRRRVAARGTSTIHDGGVAVYGRGAPCSYPAAYNFSSFAKSILKRFLPNLLPNWTSTNSVSSCISLLRIVPSPNLSWSTLSPGLNCCPFGFAGVGGVGGVILLLLFCAGNEGGIFGEGLDDGRVVHCED